MADDIRMTFSTEELAQMIKSVFKPEHAKVMSECITEILSERDPATMEVILKSAMGIDMTPAYKEGDEVFCKTTALSSWRWDKAKMKEAGLIDEDDLIKGTIVKAQKYKAFQYLFKYDYLEEKVDEPKISTDDLAERYITGLVEVFPGDEEIELLNPKENGEEDLPF